MGRCPLLSYFILAFGISWLGALAVAAPHLVHHRALDKSVGILMFPAMLLGPPASAFLMTGVLEGRAGVAAFMRGLWPKPIRSSWYFLLLIPPALVYGVLFILSRLVSPTYSPHHFWIGVFFGIPAGLLEEIGWTGFALPRLRSRFKHGSAELTLGILWALWHLPVMDFLGAASPHGHWLVQFTLAFASAMMAIRVIICWAFGHTVSIFLCQLIHISSTASLVVFGAVGTSPVQEAIWYALYSVVLWGVVFCLMLFPARGPDPAFVLN